MTERAAKLVEQVREQADNGMVDSFKRVQLRHQRGITHVSCRGSLRIPDAATADALIKTNYQAVIGSIWAKVMAADPVLGGYATNGVINPTGAINATRHLPSYDPLVGKPVVRKATYAAMQIMGKQFVLGRTIEEALKESRENRDKGYTHATICSAKPH